MAASPTLNWFSEREKCSIFVLSISCKLAIETVYSALLLKWLDSIAVGPLLFTNLCVNRWYTSLYQKKVAIAMLDF